MTKKAIHITRLTNTELKNLIEEFQGGGRYCFHSRGSNGLQMMLIYSEPGESYPLHRHIETDEHYFLLSGQMTVTIFKANQGALCPNEELHLSDQSARHLRYLKMERGSWHSLKSHHYLGAVFIEVKEEKGTLEFYVN